ncbi:MAG: type II secretion system protein [Deltaproteobacteria bacterium]|nr:type II secretion system protein [Deltaproteobacteria bacterium]
MKQKAGGFTLLEVMIAIGILAITMVAISGLQGGSLRRAGRAEKMSLAVQLARQKTNEKIIEIETQIDKGEFPEGKEEEGDFDKFPDYHWKVEIKKMEAPPIPSGGEGENVVAEQLMSFIGQKLGEMMRVVKVTISWKELEAEESFTVATHMANIRSGISSFQVQTGGTSPSGPPASPTPPASGGKK